MNTTANIIHSVPLSKLRVSAMNVRKTGSKSINDLAASIEAHGLLQNLTVVAVDNHFEVVAGARRYQALKQLESNNVIPSEFGVPCLVSDGVHSIELSTAENIIREAMHPADQFIAFKGMIENEGKSIAEVAAAFGVSELAVKQRLKLGNVSPKIMQLYKDDQATLNQVQALCITDDHKAQEHAWFSVKSNWERDPRSLRDRITKQEVSSSDARMRFITMETYLSAGGPTRSDLFGTEVFACDSKLVEKLVMEKLKKLSAELEKEGWAWVEVLPNASYEKISQYNQYARPESRPITKEEEKARKSIMTRMNEIQELDEDGDDADLSIEYEQLEQKLEAINESREIYSDKVKAKSGVLLCLTNGEPQIHRARVKPGEKVSVSSSGETTVTKAKEKPTDDLSNAAIDRLNGMRTGVLRQDLAKQPHKILAATAADLASRYLTNSAGLAYNPSVFMISRDQQADGGGEFKEVLQTSPAEKALNALKKEWHQKLTAAKPNAFEWLLTQPISLTHDLLAVIFASFLKLDGSHGDKFFKTIGKDFSPIWKPDIAWLSTLAKGAIVKIVAEVHGIKAAEPLSKMKTADAAKKAADLLANTGWLPKPLRAPGYAIKKQGNEPAISKAVATTPKPAVKKALPKPAKKQAKKKSTAKTGTKKPAQKSAKK